MALGLGIFLGLSGRSLGDAEIITAATLATGQDVWLDAFASDTFTGTTTVEAWANKLDGTEEATQATVASRPAFDTSTGKVTFDGVDDTLDLPASMMPDTSGEFTLIISGKLLTDPNSAGILGGPNIRINKGGGSLVVVINGTLGADTGVTWGDHNLFMVRATASETQVYANGVLIFSFVPPLNGGATTGVMGNRVDVNSYWSGEVGHYSVWPRALTDAELNSAGAEIAALYADMTYTDIV
jgi:hypothetical protein